MSKREDERDKDHEEKFIELKGFPSSKMIE